MHQFITLFSLVAAIIMISSSLRSTKPLEAFMFILGGVIWAIIFLISLK